MAPPVTTNLQANYDAADISGLSDGDLISQWDDSSGNANHGTATSTARPTYKVVGGVPLVRFNGSTNYLTTGNNYSLGNTVTIVAVLRPNNFTSRQTLFGQNNAASAVQLEFNASPLTGVSDTHRPNVGTIISGVFTSYARSLYQYADEPLVISYRRSGSGSGTHTLRENKQTLTLGVDATNSYTGDGVKDIGRRSSSSQHFNGDVYALLIYSGSLSDSDLESVEDYLASRYSVDLTNGRLYEFTELEVDTGMSDASIQGVAHDGTYTYIADSTKLYKYSYSGGTYTLETSRVVSGDDPASKAQVNGLSYYNGSLWVGATNYPTTPHANWIVEYDPSDLSHIATNDISGDVSGHTEGGAWYDVGSGDEFWVIYTNALQVSRYNSSFVHQANYAITGVLAQNGDTYYQDAMWIPSLDWLLVPEHSSGWSPQIHAYHWTGSGFDLVHRFPSWGSGSFQGIDSEDTTPGVGSVFLATRRDGNKTLERALFSSLAVTATPHIIGAGIGGIIGG